MISVFLIDDHLMVQAGLRALLAGHPDIAVVGSATNAYEALPLLSELRPQVVLLDIHLPDIDGIALCRRIHTDLPQSRVLGVSNSDERSTIARLLESGAGGYLFKSVGVEELTEAIRQVAAGRLYLTQLVAQILSQPAPASASLPLLTRREKEVLGCIAEGLFVSALTVDGHRKSLLAKLNVPNTASMIALAVRQQLI